jgi:hypothetical protein
MSTVQGLPAHILLVHFIVVLVPATALLAVVSALWPTVRRHVIWLVVLLAVAVAAVTPVTTEAGEWLEHRINQTDALRAHTELGDTMPYFSVALLVAVALLLWIHLRERRGRPASKAIAVAVIAVVLAASVAATVQVYRIGDSGSRSAWSDEGAAPAR